MSNNQNTAPGPGGDPEVSVIVPSYNTAPYIAETLDSVFAQTFKDYEVIVINDGSPDTEKLDRVLQPYRDRILYIKQENRGLAGARNAGIRRARGKYLAFLDSDEAWSPEYLAEQVRILQERQNLDAIYCDVLHYWDSIESGRSFMKRCPSKGPVTFESLLKEECHIPVSNTLVRKQAVVDAGLFDERLRRVEDYDLWLRMTHRKAKIAYHAKLLGRARQRKDSLSASTVAMLEALDMVLSRLQESLDLSPGERALLQWKAAETQARCELERGKDLIYEGKLDEAVCSLQKANAFYRKRKLRLVILGLKIAPRLASRGARVFQSWRSR